MLNQNVKNIKKRKAFTMLELIVAIFVISFALLGIYSIVQEIIIYNSIASSRLIAAYLAQEEIENVRNIRDRNWLQKKQWDVDISSTNGFISCNPPFSRFSKRITIIKPSDDGGLKKMEVLVEVEWKQNGKNYSVAAMENLYNWYSQ